MANIATERGPLGERAAILPIWAQVNARLMAADTAGGINPTTGFNFASELLADGQADSALVWYRAVAASAAKRKDPVIESRAQFGIVGVSRRWDGVWRQRRRSRSTWRCCARSSGRSDRGTV